MNHEIGVMIENLRTHKAIPTVRAAGCKQLHWSEAARLATRRSDQSAPKRRDLGNIMSASSRRISAPSKQIGQDHGASEQNQ